MRIVAIDDEKIALEALMSAIVKAEPDAELHGFRNASAAFAHLREHGADVVFTDISMRGTDGIDFAKKLMEESPRLNIIFTTGYSDYALKAVEMHCSGYIMKPVTEEKVKLELEKLRYPVEGEMNYKGLYIRTFGNFEVFMDGKPLNFKYQKTRELLAYLIDRRGSLCRNNEIMSVLWEDEDDETSHSSYLKNIRTDLISTLSEYGLEDCVTRLRGGIAIVRDLVNCDYFDYLDGNITDLEHDFKGEYMSQYSWAEVTLASLERGTV